MAAGAADDPGRRGERRMSSQAVVERLAAHKTLAGSPHAELEWLAARGELRRYAPGDVVIAKTALSDALLIILVGRLAMRFTRATGRRHLMEEPAGNLAGVLPFSRAGRPPDNIIADETTELFAVPRDHIADLIRECPKVTEKVVQFMVDRARRFAATAWQDDRLLSLGHLAAGISHEMNNPAAAAARDARELEGMLRELGEAAYALGAAPLSDTERLRVRALMEHEAPVSASVPATALERADREDEIVAWLAARSVESDLAPLLAQRGATIAMLDDLAGALSVTTLPAALRWIAATGATRSLTSDVSDATRRVYDLISTLQRFTFMDRSAAVEPTDVRQGLSDAATVLAARAREKAVSLRLDLAADLPAVPGNAGELNQIWANLLHNAIDAVEPGGSVRLETVHEGDTVIVRVIDDGPGIPADLQSRIFEPFYTTKDVGQGIGLGLDIARRIARTHEGDIVCESRPGRTEFRVTLPVLSA